MRIGIISDSHDRIDHVNQAIDALNSKADVLLHCGDFCSPFMMEEFAKFSGEVHAVFGNVDDRARSTKKAEEHGVHLHGDIAVLEFDGVTFALNHFPEIAVAMAMSGQFDVVCHGHTHVKREEQFGSTLLINPGELMGRKGACTYAVYDTQKRSVEFFEL